MREYRTIDSNFKNCSFKLFLPKVTFVGEYININFTVSSRRMDTGFRYIVKSCEIIDKFGVPRIFELDNCSNFSRDIRQMISIDGEKILKTEFTFILNILTKDGESAFVKYFYKKNSQVILKSVSISDITSEEEKYFMSAFRLALERLTIKNNEDSYENNDEYIENPDFKDYVKAISGEIDYLKNNGGKLHKISNGHLLSNDSGEHCYSFELESELYLSDDAPVVLKIGLETVKGNVIVCDGFQIIVSLKKYIGDTVLTGFISVEPWQLLEKLKEHINRISNNDKIAYKLFYEGPTLAEKGAPLEAIKRGQENAISQAVLNDITVIWGPPGTGKTYTMAQITKKFVQMGKTVLIVSHSNISVDNVVKQISKQFEESGLSELLSQGKVLRYGYVRDSSLNENTNCVAFNFALSQDSELKKEYETYSKESQKLKIQLSYKNDSEKAKMRKDIEQKLKKIRAKVKFKAQDYAMAAQVVATTVSKVYMDKLFENKKYDVVMFDEISMAYVPQLLCAATFAKEKFICVGDFRQLSPIVQNEKAKIVLEKDMFSFLKISENGEISNHPWLVMLDEQRRMQPNISRFSSKYIYKGLLKDHYSVDKKWDSVVEKDPLSMHPMNLLDLAGTFCAASKTADNSRFNILSGILSFSLAICTYKEQTDLEYKSGDRVGIITPYAAQTRLIRAMVQDYYGKNSSSISCATVHQFQGSERNVIIFDAVESYPFVKPGWLVSKNQNNSVIRLINVALTRARGKFITLANTTFWYNKFRETKNTYFKLLEHIKSNDNVISMKDENFIDTIRNLDFGKNIKPYFDEESTIDDLINDLKSAQKQIIITMPTDRLNPKYENEIFKILKEQSRNNVTVYGKFREFEKLNENWKSLFYKSKDAVFPLITIDSRIIWYGFPITELFFEDKNNRYLAKQSLIFRITGEKTIEMIKSLCNLEYRMDDKNNKVKIVDKGFKSNESGLSEYIRRNEKCKECDEPMELFRSYNGKYSLKCSDCGEKAMLSINVVNDFLAKKKVKCKHCGVSITASVGQYGVYTKCMNGHITKLSELE